MVRFKRVVSVTTREKRKTEEDGINYHYIDLDTYRRLDIIGRVIYDGVKPKYYGIPSNEIVDDAINIAIVNTYGVEKLKERFQHEDRRIYCVLLKANDALIKERYLSRKDVDSSKSEFLERIAKDNEYFGIEFKYDFICNTEKNLDENNDVQELLLQVNKLNNGDIVCIMGKTGTGKTTILNHILNTNKKIGENKYAE